VRKFKAILIIILTLIITYFLQVNFFTWFSIRGVMPNLFVVVVLFIGLFAGKKLGIIFGLITGLILDLVLGREVGFTGIYLGIIGFIGERLDKSFSKDNLISIIIMVTGSTILYEIFTYFTNVLKYEMTPQIGTFIVILLIEILFNIFQVIIFYPIIKRVGYYIEDIFKKKKILTRYF